MPQKPIELHYWPTPNGHKITIMLEECGLPYEIKPVNIGKGDQFKPEFLAIAPNNRMPAIVDPDGPDGKPISIFELGAILQYLGRKTGKFYPQEERARVEVEQWLYWQMANLGPNCGQAHHFRNYSQEKIPYAIDRYTNEVNRLYGVMNTRLKDRAYLAGDYSIADMASYPWVRPYKNQGQDLAEFPNLEKWFQRLHDRPAVAKAVKIGEELRANYNLATDKDAQKVLFGQRARRSTTCHPGIAAANIRDPTARASIQLVEARRIGLAAGDAFESDGREHFGGHRLLAWIAFGLGRLGRGHKSAGERLAVGAAGKQRTREDEQRRSQRHDSPPYCAWRQGAYRPEGCMASRKIAATDRPRGTRRKWARAWPVPGNLPIRLAAGA